MSSAKKHLSRSIVSDAEQRIVVLRSMLAVFIQLPITFLVDLPASDLSLDRFKRTQPKAA